MDAIERRFLEVVGENRGRILRVCRVYARSVQDREDLYQEVLFQVWRALPGFEGGSHVNTWLYRVAINTAISFVRKGGRGKRVVPDTERVEAAGEVRSVGGNPEVERLLEAISRLDKVEKALVTLFLEDLSYEEIGAVLGMRAGHVGVMLHRTKKKLSVLMKREEVSP
jgi:RNA polymerase sigma-70 factor (ECF subfamily)